jgi:hypothetical protein
MMCEIQGHLNAYNTETGESFCATCISIKQHRRVMVIADEVHFVWKLPGIMPFSVRMFPLIGGIDD